MKVEKSNFEAFLKSCLQELKSKNSYIESLESKISYLEDIFKKTMSQRCSCSYSKTIESINLEIEKFKIF